MSEHGLEPPRKPAGRGLFFEWFFPVKSMFSICSRLPHSYHLGTLSSIARRAHKQESCHAGPLGSNWA